MAEKIGFNQFMESFVSKKSRVLASVALVLFFVTIPSKLIYSIEIDENRQPLFREINLKIPDPDPYPINETGVEAPYISAKSAIIVDRQSRAVIYMKNPDEELLPASTTKMVTALVAYENYDFDEIVELGEITRVGQGMDLFSGEKIKVKNLMYGLLVQSGNDAAFALADLDPEGREGFVKKMDYKIDELNLYNSYMKNPAGVDEWGHYSSVHDLAIIGAELVSNPILLEIVSTKAITVMAENEDFTHELESTNELLGRVRGMKGIKTGWTESAGECLVTYTERNGKGIITAILGSYDRFGETEALVEWVFDNHEWVEVEMPEE